MFGVSVPSANLPSVYSPPPFACAGAGLGTAANLHQSLQNQEIQTATRNVILKIGEAYQGCSDRLARFSRWMSGAPEPSKTAAVKKIRNHQKRETEKLIHRQLMAVKRDWKNQKARQHLLETLRQYLDLSCFKDKRPAKAWIDALLVENFSSKECEEIQKALSGLNQGYNQPSKLRQKVPPSSPQPAVTMPTPVDHNDVEKPRSCGSSLFRKLSSLVDGVRSVCQYIDHQLSFPGAYAKCTTASYDIQQKSWAIAFVPSTKSKDPELVISGCYFISCTTDVWGFKIVDGKLVGNGPARNTPIISQITSMAFTPDGTWLATAGPRPGSSADQEINIFNAQLFSWLKWEASYRVPKPSKGAGKLAISPDGSLLATSNYGSKDVTLFELQDGVLSQGTSYPLDSQNSTPSPRGVNFSPDGKLLAVIESRYPPPDSVTVFKVMNGSLVNATIYPLPAGRRSPDSAAFSPDGSIFAIANGDSHDITVFKVVNESFSDAVSYPLNTEYGPNSLVFSPNGTFIATVTRDRIDYSYLTPFWVNDGVLYEQRPIPFGISSFGRPEALAFSPDGKILASANIESNDATLFEGCFDSPPPTTSPTTAAPTTSPTTPTPTSIPGNDTSNGIHCDVPCIAGVSSGGFVLIVIAGVGAFLIRRSCLKRSSGEQQPLIDSEK
jgi:WD40 repeat protein